MKTGELTGGSISAGGRLGFLRAAILGLAALAATSAAHAGVGRWSTTGPTGENVSALAMDPCDSRTVYAAGGTAIFQTTDAGMTWNPIPGSIPAARFLVTAGGCSDGTTLYTSNSHELLRSTDGGAHFSGTNLGADVFSLAVHPSDPSILYAGTDLDVLRSDDGGLHWTSVESCLISPVTSLAIDHDNPAIVFAGGGSPGDSTLDCSHDSILVATTDGTIWRRVLLYSDLPYFPDEGAYEVKGLASKPGSTGVVYASEHTGYGDSVSQFNSSRSLTISYPVGLDARISSLVVDPTRPSTVYAGTDRGVFINDHADASLSNWSTLFHGLTSGPVTSLVIDPSGKHLHAGTTNGVFDFEFSTAEPPRQCVPSFDLLCLLDGRFQVEIGAVHSRTGKVSPGFAVTQGDNFGYFSFPEFTGDTEFPEVVVKMVNGSSLPGHSFWFFESSLTSLPYQLTVTDMQTGAVRVYGSSGFCGRADTSAFPGDEGAAAATDVTNAASTQPVAGREALALLHRGRFSVTLSAVNPRNGRSASGVAVRLGDRAGYFSLPDFTGDASFPEVFVKMVDFTSVDGSFWFFYTGLTGLEYTLTVTDTTTGAIRTYEQPAGSFCGGADTRAFRE